MFHGETFGHGKSFTVNDLAAVPPEPTFRQENAPAGGAKGEEQ